MRDALKQPLILALVAMALLIAAGIPHGDARTAAAAGSIPPAGDVLQPLITTSELVVGPNRLAFGLLKDDTLVEDAEVRVRVYDIRDRQAQLQAEMTAPYERLEVVEQGNRVHIHPDGARHVHPEQTDVRGVYVTQVAFARAGTWGLEVLAKRPNGLVAVSRFAVEVRQTPQTPAIGSPAPKSRNLIVSDVGDVRQIDTSDPPDAQLHQVRIADAIAQGRPQVVVFATPKFCTSRLCGPMVDIVRTLVPAYGDRVVFTHQEIWQDASAQQLFATVEEWNLPSEPWIFVVDGKGIVRAKFEGLATARELEAALKPLLERE